MGRLISTGITSLDGYIADAGGTSFLPDGVRLDLELREEHVRHGRRVPPVRRDHGPLTR